LLVAAFTVVKVQINNRSRKVKLFAAQHGKLIFIRMGSVAISEQTL